VGRPVPERRPAGFAGSAGVGLEGLDHLVHVLSRGHLVLGAWSDSRRPSIRPNREDVDNVARRTITTLTDDLDGGDETVMFSFKDRVRD
jgi:hypothetical protein